MTPLSDANTWIIGLDLGERSRGALVLAQWLTGSSDEAIGVHVLESWSRPYVRGEPIAAVHAAVTRTAHDLRIAPLARVKAVEAGRAEEGLVRAAEGATALIIGRAARVGERPISRLGHVARRVLRELPAPVIVVPPDLTAVAPGPILLATDLDRATAGAIRFARGLAARQGRALEVVHVGMPRHSDLIDELEPSWAHARDLYRTQVARSFENWAEEHDLAGLPRHLVFGNTIEGIEAVALGCNAAMVVVGSRRLDVAGRLFLGSTASALAGYASCPVAVVPFW